MADAKPKFDPNKPFEEVKPKFDPNKPFDEVKKKEEISSPSVSSESISSVGDTKEVGLSSARSVSTVEPDTAPVVEEEKHITPIEGQRADRRIPEIVSKGFNEGIAGALDIVDKLASPSDEVSKEVAYQAGARPFKFLADIVRGASSDVAPPSGIVENVAYGVGAIAPEIVASRFFPTVSMGKWLGKYGIQEMDKFAMLLAAKGGASAAGDAKGKSALDQVVDPIVGAAEGFGTGWVYRMMGGGAHGAGDAVAKKLFGEAMAQKVASATTSTLANAVMFGGYGAAEEYKQTGEVTWDNTAINSGMGVALGLSGIYAAVKGKAFNTYLSTDRNTVNRVLKTQEDPSEIKKLAEEVVEKDTKAAAVMDQAADIKAVAEDIIEKPAEYIGKIKDSALPEGAKEDIIKKINETVADNDARAQAAKPIVEEINKELGKIDAINNNQNYSQVEKDAMVKPLQGRVEELKTQVEEIYNTRDWRGAEITPHKEVKASQQVAVKEIAGARDMKEMEVGLLYSKFKGGEPVPAPNEGLTKSIFDKFEYEYIEPNENGDYVLTEAGRGLVDAVGARIETRRGVKAGTDMFPETANIPEMKPGQALGVNPSDPVRTKTAEIEHQKDSTTPDYGGAIKELSKIKREQQVEEPVKSEELAGQRTRPSEAGGVEKRAEQSELPSGQLKTKPTEDNFRKPLDTYTDVLYQEASPSKALEYVSTTTDMGGDQYFSNSKNLALGQGANKGVIVELDASKISGQVNNSKPGWEVAYDNGDAEFVARNNSQSDYRSAVKTITIDKNIVSPKEAAKFDRRVNTDEWDRVETDSEIRYSKKQTDAIQKPSAAEVPVRESSKDSEAVGAQDKGEIAEEGGKEKQVAPKQEEPTTETETIQDLQEKLARREISLPEYTKRMEAARKRNKAVVEKAINGERDGEYTVELSLAPPSFRRRVGKFLKETFTTYGSKPALIFETEASSSAAIRARQEKISSLIYNLRSAAKKEYGKITEQVKETIDDALHNVSNAINLPVPVAKEVLKIRMEIDALTQELISSGMIKGGLITTMGNNLGLYVTRSFKVHDSKEKWLKELPDDVKEKAVLKVISDGAANGKQITRDEAIGIVESILRNAGEDNFSGMSSVAGRINRGILKTRKNIPQEYLDLLGQWKDPFVNSAKTLTKMSVMLENYKMSQRLANEGKDVLFFDKPIENFADQIPDSDSWGELKGKYTSREIKEALVESQKELPEWVSTWMRINGFAKYGKTILSPVTQIRNMTSNFLFHVANGRWNYAKMKDVVDLMRVEFSKGRRAKDQKEADELYDLVRRGVLKDGAYMGEIREAINDAMRGKEDAYLNSVGKVIYRTARAAEKLYQAGDDVHKAFAFYVELSRLVKQYGGSPSDEALRNRAAQKVIKTMPTYSRVPENIKALRRFPVLGSFVSFPAEVFRTTFNTIELALDEMRRPQERSTGVKRLVGMTFALSLPSAISAYYFNKNNLSPQDDERLSRFVSPWSKNSQLIPLYVDKKKGIVKYIDMSYSDPYNYLKKGVIAALRGGFTKESMWEAIGEYATPFLGEELMTKRMLDVRSNKRSDNDRSIYNEQAELGDQATDVLTYLLEGMEPGVSSSIRRLFDKSKDPEVEAVATVTGQRMTTVDIPKSLRYKATDYKRNLQEAKNIYFSKAYRDNTTRDEALSELRNANKAGERLFMEMREDIMSALGLGIDGETVFKSLEESGLSPNEIGYLLSGYYPGFVPQDISPLLKE